MNRPDTRPWVPLRSRPERCVRQRLKACRIEPNETEFAEFRGVRYLRREENGVECWLSKRTHLLSFMERDGVEVCCVKMRWAWRRRRFFDLGKNWKRGTHLVIFAKDIFPNQITSKKRTVEITFCPFCGRKIKFLSESGEPEVRAVSAGRRA